MASDVMDHGIMMTGGGALLKNLEILLHEMTGLPVFLAEDPLSAVVIGAGKTLEDLEMLHKICQP